MSLVLKQVHKASASRWALCAYVSLQTHQDVPNPIKELLYCLPVSSTSMYPLVLCRKYPFVKGAIVNEVGNAELCPGVFESHLRRGLRMFWQLGLLKLKHSHPKP